MRTRTHAAAQRGVALLSAVVMMVLVLAFGLSLVSLTASEHKAGAADRDTFEARNMAEAGMEKALRQLDTDPSWRCEGQPADFTDAPLVETVEGEPVTLGTFTVDKVEDLPDGTLQVTSHGYYPRNTPGAAARTVRMVISSHTASPFLCGVYARNTILFSGGKAPNTDSFDSSNGINYAGQPHGCADVRVDSTDPSAVTVSGGSGIGGDIQYGPGTNLSKVSVKHAYIYDGDTNPTNDFQAAPSFLNPPSVTVPAGVKEISEINNGSRIVSNMTIPGGTYVCDGINIPAGNKVRVTGRVILYVRGDTTKNTTSSITISGSGFANNGDDVAGITSHASNLQIYATPACTKVTISGSANLTAAIYAPDSAIVKSSGSTQFYGALIGKTVEVSGGGSVHYDRALSSESSSGKGNLQAKAWAEM